MNLFRLKPAGKDYLWGGEKLKKEFHKDFDLTPLAETWECSGHPDGKSLIDSGEFAGTYLIDRIREDLSLIGKEGKDPSYELPVLIKFIDAKENLSLQVHPSDAYAFEKECGQKGKSEMWYIIAAEEDAKIICGFNRDMTAEEVEEEVLSGEILKDCQVIPVKAGEYYYIPSGTVHAICRGSLIAEIQESSNLTYRLYDYKRKDKNGKERELHLQRALEVLDFKKKEIPSGLKEENELLIENEYFSTSRWKIEDKRYCKVDKKTFCAILCIDGEGLIVTENEEEQLKFRKGDCFFVPASSSDYQILGKSVWLSVKA